MERVRCRTPSAAGLTDDGQPLRDGGTGATAYAEAVAVYLAFAISQVGRRSEQHRYVVYGAEDGSQRETLQLVKLSR